MVHRADARLLRGVRAREAHLLAGQSDHARVERERPGDGLDQRGLAGAVLAHQRVDLARVHPEVHPVEGELGPEGHGGSRDFDDRCRAAHGDYHAGIAGMPGLGTALYLRRDDRATMNRCTTTKISSRAPMKIRVQACEAPRNEITVLIVP